MPVCDIALLERYSVSSRVIADRSGKSVNRFSVSCKYFNEPLTERNALLSCPASDILLVSMLKVDNTVEFRKAVTLEMLLLFRIKVCKCFSLDTALGISWRIPCARFRLNNVFTCRSNALSGTDMDAVDSSIVPR